MTFPDPDVAPAMPAHDGTDLQRGGPNARAPHGPILMVVHAHPDDESSQTGGTLAAYSAAGWRTVLITCTDGGQGDGPGGTKPGQPGHDPRQVAARRSRELDLAAVALGIHEVVKLGYPDSGMPADTDPTPPPEAFSQRPMMPMITRLVRLIRLHRPDVIVTYPPNGLSGHPDHIRTHQLVHAALRHIDANRAARAGAGDDPAYADTSDAAPLLYYIAVSRSRLRAVQTGARSVLGPQAWVPPDEMAIDNAEVTTVIDVAAHWRDKLQALSAHASQSDATAILIMLSAADGADTGGRVEEYVRRDARFRRHRGGVEAGFAGVAPRSVPGGAASATGPAGLRSG
jgi:LmbE family N-acetylglucosaminyl deacetylase